MHADWIELFALFEKNGVRYLVIGGYAVGFHGFERYTKDIDVWIAANKTNAKAIMKSLAAFGVQPTGLSELDFIEPESIVMIGVEPYRIDFLTGPAGGRFNAAWPRRVRHNRSGVIVNYVGLDDLVALKEAAGRDVDRRDVAALRVAQRARDEAADRAPAPQSRKSRAGRKTKGGGARRKS